MSASSRRDRQVDEMSTMSGYPSLMIKASKSIYRGYRFPAEVIEHAVWLYFRFPLSLRMVEDLLAARGITVSHQTVRCWAEKFGRIYANKIRRRAPQFGDKWHLDEVVISINGKKHWLWRAVDADGFVLDALVQSRRDRRAAERLLRKLIRKQARAPRVMVTDKLGSYGAARTGMGMNFEHRQHKGLNNRAENSHLPTRGREKIMKRFKSARHLQRFCLHSRPDRQPSQLSPPRNFIARLSSASFRGDDRMARDRGTGHRRMNTRASRCSYQTRCPTS